MTDHLKKFVPAILLIGWCLMMCAGCGPSTAQYPPLGKVDGVVTASGKPLGGVMVIFQPTAGNRSSSGTTDQEGKFRLTYVRTIQGAEVGEHEVTFQPVLSDDGSFAAVPAGTESKKTRVAVENGQNEFRFELDRLK